MLNQGAPPGLEPAAVHPAAVEQLRRTVRVLPRTMCSTLSTTRSRSPVGDWRVDHWELQGDRGETGRCFTWGKPVQNH